MFLEKFSYFCRTYYIMKLVMSGLDFRLVPVHETFCFKNNSTQFSK